MQSKIHATGWGNFMAYIDDNLTVGENVIYRAKLHWVVFLWPIICFAFAIVFLLSNVVFPRNILLVIAIILSIRAFINYYTSEFGVTNKRVIVKAGFIRRVSLEILLTKVEGIQVSQGILGRILDYGSILVSGTGGSKDPVHNISAPMEFRKKSKSKLELFKKDEKMLDW